jgi:hypothetical protein
MTHEIVKYDALSSACVMACGHPRVGDMGVADAEWQISSVEFVEGNIRLSKICPEDDMEDLFGHTTAVRSVRRSSLFVRRSGTPNCVLPPPRSLRVRCTRRIVNPKGRAMGSCRRDRHTASLDSAGSTTDGATGRLAAVCGPVDPALMCGENSWPGRVHHRLEDSREAIL